MTRRVAWGAVLALTAALAAGCDSSDDRDGGEYVALGDSYTAASLTGPPQRPASWCGRSETNYPSLVAEELDMELVDVSCNGASTRDLEGSQERANQTAPPQLDAVDDDTDLVTISLGGNDFGFLGRIQYCAAKYGDQGGSPCTDLNRAAGAQSVEALLPQVEDNVVTAIRDVRDQAPDAQIIVVGYPQPFPAEGTCEEAPLPAGDYPWARSVIEGLNDALAAAAEAEDVTHVDVATASEGHDICSDDPWVAGAVVPDKSTSPWHPYAEAADNIADLVVAAAEDE
ncbi:SGNH/GDSL hydrolase family protein [Nocardioides silvaticus]|nr:SGNH/GDSL hydrolase family protein [Nocardioides silvaticus]